MHSIFARISNVSSFLSTCLMVLLAAVAVSSLFLATDPKGKVDIVSLKVWVQRFVAFYQASVSPVLKSGLVHTAPLDAVLSRYNAKAKRYPFKEQEFGFLKFDIDAGMSCCFCMHLPCGFCFLHTTRRMVHAIKPLGPCGAYDLPLLLICLPSCVSCHEWCCWRTTPYLCALLFGMLRFHLKLARTIFDDANWRALPTLLSRPPTAL